MASAVEMIEFLNRARHGVKEEPKPDFAQAAQMLNTSRTAKKLAGASERVRKMAEAVKGIKRGR